MNQPRRLTIAIVSDAIYPYHKGGKENRIYELTTRLSRAGHNVHLYTMQWWEGAPDRLENGVHLHALCRHYPLYVKGRRSIYQAVMFALATLKLITRDFDIIEADHMPFLPLFPVKLVSLIKRKPLYATWHEVVGPAYWRRYLGRLGVIAAWLEGLSVRLPSHIIAVSAITAERLRSELGFKGPLTIAANGVDIARLSTAKAGTQTSDVIFVGRLVAHKNVDLLIKAIATLAPNHPQLHCLIVGGGPEEANLRHLADSLGLGSHITFTGRLEADAAIHAAMKASRVFVLPSAREGFSITMLEAMACGLPVITVDLPDNAARGLVNDQTGLVCAADPTAIAEAISTMLETSSKLSPAQFVKRFDWDEATHYLLEAYGQ